MSVTTRLCGTQTCMPKRPCANFLRGLLPVEQDAKFIRHWKWVKLAKRSWTQAEAILSAFLEFDEQDRRACGQ